MAHRVGMTLIIHLMLMGSKHISLIRAYAAVDGPTWPQWYPIGGIWVLSRAVVDPGGGTARDSPAG